jgi:hypothetical protein
MVIDEEKVTKWEGDEEEQQRLEEALREAEGDMKTKKGAKSLLSLDDKYVLCLILHSLCVLTW